MEAYGRRYIDLCLTYKRMKEQLDTLRGRRDQAKDNLYRCMVKMGVENTTVSIRNNSTGKTDAHPIVRDKIKPKPKIPRKKKKEVEEDIANVLEHHGVDHAQEIVKEIENARKAKGGVNGASGSQPRGKYGDVIYE
jgi:hypothetical protein